MRERKRQNIYERADYLHLRKGAANSGPEQYDIEFTQLLNRPRGKLYDIDFILPYGHALECPRYRLEVNDMIRGRYIGQLEKAPLRVVHPEDWLHFSHNASWTTRDYGERHFGEVCWVIRTGNADILSNLQISLDGWM